MMVEQFTAVLGCDCDVRDLLLLLRRMDEIVPTNAAWERVNVYPRESLRAYAPTGIDVRRRTGVGDYVWLNPWADKVIGGLTEWNWLRRRLPHWSAQGSMPSNQRKGFGGRDSLVGGNLCYLDVCPRGRRPYDFAAMPNKLPRWLMLRLMQEVISVAARYRERHIAS